MDRNSIIGIVLIVAILFGYTLWTMPSDEEKAAYQRQLDSLANVEAERYARLEEEKLKADSAKPVVAVAQADTSVSAADQALAIQLDAFGFEDADLVGSSEKFFQQLAGRSVGALG